MAPALPTSAPTAEATATAGADPTLVAQAGITPTIEVTATQPLSETVAVVEAPKSPEEIRMEKIIAIVEQVGKEHGIEVFADQTLDLPLLRGEKQSISMGGDQVARPPEIPTVNGNMLNGEELSLKQRQAMANEGLELIVQEHPELDLSQLKVIDAQYENGQRDNVTLEGLKTEIIIMCNDVTSANLLADALGKALAGEVEAEFYHPEGSGIGTYYLLDSETGLFMVLGGLVPEIGFTGNLIPVSGDISSSIGNKLTELYGGEENVDLTKVFTHGVVLFSLSGTPVENMQTGLDRLNALLKTIFTLDNFASS